MMVLGKYVKKPRKHVKSMQDMTSLTKEYYIYLRKILSKLHIHAFLDRLLTVISKRVPLPLIRYDSMKLSLGFYTLVVIEDVETLPQIC